ncbi:hypothetical protein [Rhodococcus sp. A5(2022)]|uniref:hypothetical protein n=1 Tax=Rhodococcus sp. A5(2022) TaxID=3003588 RepID=UPI0022A87DB3|nr:hypothetical protein [Rhodococcus sp. A5(2022)]MCZ1075051.1 hypothetical protein [Rhodococcus sp. A5(2022)]
MSTPRGLEVPLSVEDTARMLGWQGPGTHTSPSYDTVLKACQRGELPAYQAAGPNGPRKCRWMILPSHAVAWRMGKRSARALRRAS